MSRETMQAGRELDALIAAKVMGKRVVPDSLNGGAPLEFFGEYPEGIYLVPKLYSSEIRQAWKVIERLIADGWFPQVQFNNWGAESWYVTLTRDTSDKRFGHGSGVAATAPLAICRAALRALETVRTPDSEGPALAIQASPTGGEK